MCSGSTAAVLTACNTTYIAVPTELETIITVLSPSADKVSQFEFYAIQGTLGPFVAQEGLCDVALSNSVPPKACTAITNPLEVVDKVVLIDRGGCTFLQKLMNAQEAGAAAAIIVNNQNQAAFAMSGEATTAISISSWMVPKVDGNKLREYMDEFGIVSVDIVPKNSDYVGRSNVREKVMNFQFRVLMVDSFEYDHRFEDERRMRLEDDIFVSGKEMLFSLYNKDGKSFTLKNAMLNIIFEDPDAGVVDLVVLDNEESTWEDFMHKKEDDESFEEPSQSTEQRPTGCSREEKILHPPPPAVGECFREQRLQRDSVCNVDYSSNVGLSFISVPQKEEGTSVDEARMQFLSNDVCYFENKPANHLEFELYATLADINRDDRREEFEGN